MPLVISPFPSKTMERSLLARAQCNKKYQKRVATVASFLSFIFHKFILTKRCNTVGCRQPSCQKMGPLLKDVGNEKRGRGQKSIKEMLTPLCAVPMGPFIYYVSTFLGFLDPPPPHVSMFSVSIKNKQKWAFSDPPPPCKCLRNI